MFKRSQEVTHNNLPEAIAYLIQEVESLKEIIATLQPPAEDEQKYIDIDEACEMLKLAKSTVYRLASNGGIPVSKRGKKLYFNEAELREWIDGGRNVYQTKEEIEKQLREGIKRKPKYAKW